MALLPTLRHAKWKYGTCSLLFLIWSVGILLYRCMLHNFAGNIEMYGILDAIASGPIEALTSENSTMVSCITDFFLQNAIKQLLNVIRSGCFTFYISKQFLYKVVLIWSYSATFTLCMSTCMPACSSIACHANEFSWNWLIHFWPFDICRDFFIYLFL